MNTLYQTDMSKNCRYLHDCNIFLLFVLNPHRRTMKFVLTALTINIASEPEHTAAVILYILFLFCERSPRRALMRRGIETLCRPCKKCFPVFLRKGLQLHAACDIMKETKEYRTVHRVPGTRCRARRRTAGPGIRKSRCESAATTITVSKRLAFFKSECLSFCDR